MHLGDEYDHICSYSWFSQPSISFEIYVSESRMVIPPQSDRTQEDKTCVDILCFAKARKQNGAK